VLDYALECLWLTTVHTYPPTLQNCSLAALPCPEQGSTWYTIDDTNFFATLLSKYNRTHLAGPSGSAVLLHTLFFDLLG
jgi:hypothetical protein